MEDRASAGHQLGQRIGDWWEEYVVLPLLREISDELGLYLDNRFIDRPARSGDKIIWNDDSGNRVDYDFVLELDGTDEEFGIPVGFVEVFWRRGARHSKDKARDDSGKLRPMRETYPTARFLGVAACGELTKPARELIKGQNMDLFFVPKSTLIEAFEKNDLIMDYPDRSTEQAKAELAQKFIQGFDDERKKLVASTLIEDLGQARLDAYMDRIRGSLGALPVEIRFTQLQASDPVVFESIWEASEFLDSPEFEFNDRRVSYFYRITYSNGDDFSRRVQDLDELRSLNRQLTRLADHMERMTRAARRVRVDNVVSK